MNSCCSSDIGPTETVGDVVTRSIITCPHCGASKPEDMQLNACRIVYQCSACGATLRPVPGDCCVFCSYGSVPCPPIQVARRCPPAAASAPR